MHTYKFKKYYNKMIYRHISKNKTIKKIRRSTLIKSFHKKEEQKKFMWKKV